MNRYRKEIFPTYIYQYSLREKNQVLKELLLPKILQYRKDYKIDKPSGWITDKVYTTFEQENLNYQMFIQPNEVRTRYEKHFSQVFGKGTEFIFTSAWFNYYENGEYQEEHDHMGLSFNNPDAHFSAIHFLQFDSERHVPVTFIDSLSKLNRRYTNFYVYNPQIEEGDLLIFPAHLSHRVRPSQPTPDYPRITVAFNLHIRSTIHAN
jgi:Putative 2OG-Fe(II) oxygenase